MSDRHEKHSLLQIAIAFFRIGMISLGGGSTAWIHREIVMRLGWITDDEFLVGVAVAQLLPGVNTTNLTVYTGHRLRGWRGAGAALAGFLSGPFVIAVLVAMSYRRILGAPGVDGAMIGIAAVALGMIMRVGLLSARKSWRSPVAMLTMIAAFAAVGVMHWPIIPVVLILAPISVASARLAERRRDG